MIDRTVVVLEPALDGGLSIRLEEAPMPFSRQGRKFVCPPDDFPPLSAPGAVLTHGKKLFRKLNQNREIKKAIERVMEAPDGEVRPLYFRVEVPEADLLSWETLWTRKARYLALDRKWPIGRIASTTASRQVTRTFRPPLKIMAVLSALDIEAEPEWDELYAAVASMRASDFPVAVTALVGEQALFDKLTDQVAGDPALTVHAVPRSSSELQRMINQVRPHILHCFCHGWAGYNVSQLEFATITDRAQPAGRRRSSVVLTVQELKSLKAVNHLWLVTLDCCEGGKASEDVHSLAHGLVEAGVPAAVGWREPIASADAVEFCRAFYGELLTTLGADLVASGTDGLVDVEWAAALYAARGALSDQHERDPDRHRQWALPVLYVRPTRFEVVVLDDLRSSQPTVEDAPDGGSGQDRIAVTDEQVELSVEHVAAEADTLGGMLEQLAPEDSPPGVLDELRRHYDAELSRLR